MALDIRLGRDPERTALLYGKGKTPGAFGYFFI